jgi:hypothetical protein
MILVKIHGQHFNRSPAGPSDPRPLGLVSTGPDFTPSLPEILSDQISKRPFILCKVSVKRKPVDSESDFLIHRPSQSLSRAMGTNRPRPKEVLLVSTAFFSP